jgi:hypothetical protein
VPLRGWRITNTAFTGISIKESPDLPRQAAPPPAPPPVRIIGLAPFNEPLRPSGARARACILPHSLCTAGHARGRPVHGRPRPWPACARPATPVVKPGICGAGGDGNLRPPAPHAYSGEERTPLAHEICARPPWPQPPSFYRPATHSSSHSAALGRVSLIVDLFTVLACSAAALQSECGFGYVWIIYIHTRTHAHIYVI